jgi:predicted ATPase/DNA-binding SARP family transcriptional activator
MSGPVLEFLLLGRPEVIFERRPLRLERRKTQALLYLVACRETALGRSAAAGMLWPERPPDRARQSLRQALYDAGEVAGSPLVVGEGRFLRFAEGISIENDAARFAALAQTGLSSLGQDVDGAIRMAPANGQGIGAREALLSSELLYRGEFLEGFYLDDAADFEDWQIGEAERLRSLAASVETALSRLALASGDLAGAESRAREAIRMAPSFELGHCLLLQALSARGDLGAARDHAAQFRASVLRDLGREPGPAFQALLRRLGEARDTGPPNPPAGPLKGGPAPTAILRRPPLPTTSLVGRESELSAICTEIHPGRLVSLVGTGGIGKTRLAIEAAQRRAEAFGEGAAFVDLVPCARDADVTPAIAAALGLRLGEGGAASLPCYLASRSILLILDNCEHVLEGAAEAAAGMVPACPGICVLATSRERLAVPGEILHEVPALGMPAPHEVTADPELAMASEAPRLLAERAKAAMPAACTGLGSVADIVDVCARLDALPLAIELVAVRVAALGARAVRDLLDRRLEAALDLLDGGNRDPRAAHRALSALFDWSWDTLDAAERRFFAKLSVFRGSFSFEAAEAVGGEDAWCILQGLVEKRLVSTVTDRTGGRRFRLLETIKAYAGKRLLEGGGLDPARRAYVAYYSSLASRLEEGLRILKSIDALERARDDLDEFEASMRFALGIPGKAGVAAHMAKSLLELFHLHGAMKRLGDVVAELEPRAGELDALSAADFRFALGHYMVWASDDPHGVIELEKAAEAYLGAGDSFMAAYSLAVAGCGNGTWSLGDITCSRQEKSLALFRSIRSDFGIAYALARKAEGCLTSRMVLAEGESALKEGMPCAEAAGSLPLLSTYWFLFAFVANCRHEQGEALRCLSRSVEISAQLDDPGSLGDAAQLRAEMAYESKDFEAGLEASRECRECRQREGDAIGMAYAMRYEAAGLACLGQVAGAIALEEEAVDIVLPTGDINEISFHRMSVGLLELGRGNPDRARDIAFGLMAAARSTPDSIQVPRNLMRVGRFHVFMDEEAEAILAFKEAERHPAADYIQFNAWVALAILEPWGGWSEHTGPFLSDQAATGLDNAANIGLGLGLHLIEAGFLDLGLETAGRCLAMRQVLPPLLWTIVERTQAARIGDDLRRRFGASIVDPAIDGPALRYAEKVGRFYSEMVELAPRIDEACALSRKQHILGVSGRRQQASRSTGGGDTEGRTAVPVDGTTTDGDGSG